MKNHQFIFISMISINIASICTKRNVSNTHWHKMRKKQNPLKMIFIHMKYESKYAIFILFIIVVADIFFNRIPFNGYDDDIANKNFLRHSISSINMLYL